MAAFLCLVFGATAVLASTGAIDPVNHYAWNDNGGYVKLECNWRQRKPSPINCAHPLHLVGWFWLDQSLSYVSGVTNNAGTLGGYAWGTNTGWINFTV